MYKSYDLNNKVMVRNVAITDDFLFELKPDLRREEARQFKLHRAHICSASFKSTCMRCFVSGVRIFKS